MKHEIVVAAEPDFSRRTGYVRLCLTCGECSFPPRYMDLYDGGVDEVVNRVIYPSSDDYRLAPCESRK